MSDTRRQTMPYSLATKLKLSAEEEKLIKIREHLRRQRKEKLYSYPTPAKSCNTLP